MYAEAWQQQKTRDFIWLIQAESPKKPQGQYRDARILANRCSCL